MIAFVALWYHVGVIVAILLASLFGMSEPPTQDGRPSTEPPVAIPEQPPAPEGAPPPMAVPMESAKARVLESIGQTLRRRAFVPGVDFSTWSELAQPQLQSLQTASDRDFVRGVNRLLASYKVSHLRLQAPEQKEEPSKAPPAERAPQSRVLPQPGSRTPTDPKLTNATLSWPRDNAAVLKLRSFDSDVYNRAQIDGYFAEIRDRAQYLIIDLRGNGGGAVDALSHLLSQLVPEGTAVGVYVNRDMASRYERAKGEPSADAVEIATWSDRKYRIRRGPSMPFKGRIAVLISRSSASASEITAAALRDHANALLVGQPSAGKVLMSIHANLTEGYKLQLPTSDYVTMKGVRLEGNPLRPHIVLPSARRQPDQAVGEALSVLLEGL